MTQEIKVGQIWKGRYRDKFGDVFIITRCFSEEGGCKYALVDISKGNMHYPKFSNIQTTVLNGNDYLYYKVADNLEEYIDKQNRAK